jgi:hypothetical protein
VGYIECGFEVDDVNESYVDLHARWIKVLNDRR